MAILNFDASQVDPNEVFEPIPEGWYIMKLIESEMKPTQTGGAYLNLKFQIIDGEYTGRFVFDRLNLQNPNEKTVEIAYRTLSAICHAVEVLQVQDSQQLHGIPLQVKIILKDSETGNDGKNYGPKNEIKGYKGIESNKSIPPSIPSTNSQKQPASSPPWASQQNVNKTSLQATGTPVMASSPPWASQQNVNQTSSPPWAKK